MTDWQPTIPGLDLAVVQGGPHASAITTAARATLASLDSQGLLRPHHAVTVQMVLSLAAAVDRGVTAGRVSVATATLARQLQDTIATLPTGSGVSDDEVGAAFDNLAKAMAEAIR